jgi:hypothetical protein
MPAIWCVSCWLMDDHNGIVLLAGELQTNQQNKE